MWRPGVPLSALCERLAVGEEQFLPQAEKIIGRASETLAEDCCEWRQ